MVSGLRVINRVQRQETWRTRIIYRTRGRRAALIAELVLSLRLVPASERDLSVTSLPDVTPGGDHVRVTGRHCRHGPAQCHARRTVRSAGRRAGDAGGAGG